LLQESAAVLGHLAELHLTALDERQHEAEDKFLVARLLTMATSLILLLKCCFMAGRRILRFGHYKKRFSERVAAA